MPPPLSGRVGNFEAVAAFAAAVAGLLPGVGRFEAVTASPLPWLDLNRCSFEALARSWGVIDRRPVGKTVWGELSVPPGLSR